MSFEEAISRFSTSTYCCSVIVPSLNCAEASAIAGLINEILFASSLLSGTPPVATSSVTASANSGLFAAILVVTFCSVLATSSSMVAKSAFILLSLACCCNIAATSSRCLPVTLDRPSNCIM